MNVATWQVLPGNYFSSRLRNRHSQHIYSYNIHRHHSSTTKRLWTLWLTYTTTTSMTIMYRTNYLQIILHQLHQVNETIIVIEPPAMNWYVPTKFDSKELPIRTLHLLSYISNHMFCCNLRLSGVPSRCSAFTLFRWLVPAITSLTTASTSAGRCDVPGPSSYILTCLMCNYNPGGPDPRPSYWTRVNLELVNRDRVESELCGRRGRTHTQTEREWDTASKRIEKAEKASE